MLLLICVVTYQLKSGSASRLLFASASFVFVSQAGDRTYIHLGSITPADCFNTIRVLFMNLLVCESYN